MSQLALRTLAMLALVLGFALPAAADDPPVRVRGTIERVDGDVYIFKEPNGAELKIKLPANPLGVAITQARLADIKQGSYVGVSGMPQADGSQKALEVHIFPET